MANLPSISLKILQGRLTTIAGELVQVQFRSRSLPHAWCPRLNVYRCGDRLVIGVELAGIDRTDIELQVEPRRVWFSAWRRPLEPDEKHGPARQILALEIDEGRCEREVILPVDIVPEEVRAEQRNGLLWIDLPLRLPSVTATFVEPLIPP